MEVKSQAGALSSEITRRTVQLYAQRTGRGPTEARTVLGRDAVIVILESVLTKGEHRLVAGGDGNHVLATRHTLQELMSTELVEMVETATGRSVRAFMSSNWTEPDAAAEIFLLEPATGGAAPAASG
jgi:uncharacterized protein YbcI